ncbi:MAG: hypothetical protein WHS46_00005 [Desulfosoma sp.]
MAFSDLERLREFQGRVHGFSGLPIRLRESDVPMDLLESLAAFGINNGAMFLIPKT